MANQLFLGPIVTTSVAALLCFSTHFKVCKYRSNGLSILAFLVAAQLNLKIINIIMEWIYPTGKTRKVPIDDNNHPFFYNVLSFPSFFPFLTPFLAATLSDGKIAFSLPCHFLGEISTKNDDIKVRLNSFFPSAWCSLHHQWWYVVTLAAFSEPSLCIFSEVDKWKRAKNCYLFFRVRLAKLKPGISRSSSDIICNCVTHSFGQKRLTWV